MSYHDSNLYKTQWNKPKKIDEESERTGNPPSVQIISPQKKLYDIQQVIDSLPNKHMTTYELQAAIQKILDGEV